MITDHAFTPEKRGRCIFPVRVDGTHIPCGKMRGLHAKKEQA